MKPAVFLTGATGFLGMEVLARLLEAGDREVLALVRARRRRGGRAAARRRAGHAVGRPGAVPRARDRRARRRHAAGARPRRRAATRWPSSAHAVLHCAASISFDLPLPEARAINVDGTSRVLDFALEAQARGGLERFLHVSTAYVSGRHEGAFRERQLDTGQSFRNTYEQTKADAEQIVAMARELGPAIARPSIVDGRERLRLDARRSTSSTGRCSAFSRGLFKELPALPTGRVDIVPVDYVADGLVHLLDRREAGVFNLVAGRNAPTVEELTDAGVGVLRQAAARRSSTRSIPTRGDDHDSVYVPYFDMRVVFDDARARAVLAPAGIEAPPLREYFARLMEYAEAARWGKQKMTREAARSRRAEPAPT